MTAEQLVKPLRIVSDAQRRRLTEAATTPTIQRALKDARVSVLGAQLREQLQEQIDFQRRIRPALLEQMREQVREQNVVLRRMLDAPGIKRALVTIDFKLPEVLADQIAAYREQLAAEVTADPDVAEETAGRLAQDREAIIKCLRRVGIAVEGFSYLPESPVPPLVGFLILVLAALGEVADEILAEREDEE
ncbi:MAG TPA: hypothetical protein VFY69_03450 [Solirubrobacterales bacterium]|nr:hypothetical protein [Solirubrobacterales bacterium]